MMTGLMNDIAWIKASDLIKERYGKSLSYRAIKLISNDLQIKESEHYYLSGEDLIIPLKLKDSNLGDVVVKSGSELHLNQKTEITDLIKFLIEPKIYNIQLKQIEENLSRAKVRTLSLVQKQSVVPIHQNNTFRKQTLSQVILLKSHTEMTRNKVALKLHEMTERNLFVHLKDVLPSLSASEDLGSLSDVTIYIDEIENLPSASLELVQDYLAKDQSTGPLFLIGSSLSPDVIRQKNWLTSFKNDLIGFHFDIDRVPLSQQVSEDVLELLFFQLDTIQT